MSIGKKLLELREIAPSAAVLTSTYHSENSDYDSEETETVDEEECVKVFWRRKVRGRRLGRSVECQSRGSMVV